MKTPLKAEYLIGLILLLLISLGLIFLFLISPDSSSNPSPQVRGEPYVEIANPSGFVNTSLNPDGSAKPITIGELVGEKIILVDFMTYSCINCQRTFPYLNAWYKKYKDQGLEIIGIHTPEFAFEKDIENVREAMKRFGIMHPVVLDNDYATWRAYGNRFWPRKYLIDIHGNIVYDHIGEGKYEETEMKIMELLSERAEVLGEENKILQNGLASSEISEDISSAKSPEIYFGSSRNNDLANGTAGRQGEQNFFTPSNFSLNRLYLGGSWNIEPEYSESVSDSRIFFRYNAREVFMVASADTPTEIEIWQDEKIVTTEAGENLDGQGKILIQESGLYKIIRNQEAGEHLLEIRLSPGVEVYTFTFG